MLKNAFITLTYNAQNLRQLYFGHGADDLWKYENFRMKVLLLSVALVSIPIFNLIVRELNQPLFLIVIILAVFLIIWKSIEIIIQIWKFLKWKRTVKQFISKLDGTTETIEWTQAAFTYTNIDETNIVRWQEVKQVQILPTHITITAAKDVHIFPALAMEPDEYEDFCNVLKTAVSRVVVSDD